MNFFNKKILTITAIALVSVLAIAGTDRVLDGKSITVGGVVLQLPTTAGTITTDDGTSTLENKTISGASNTLSNISLTSSVTGTLPIANGGTGQTTAQAAIDALLPSQASANGQFLTSDGTNASWASITSANTNLSNLASPVAINQTLLSGSGTDLSLATNNDGTADANPTDSMNFTTGNKTAGTGNSGSFNFTAGTSAGGAQGNFVVDAETLNFQGNTITVGGAVLDAVGTMFNNGDAELGIKTNDNAVADANPTGNIAVTTGNKSAGTGNSGDFSVIIGTSSGGSQGNIKLLKDGVASVIGDVWTATSTDGAGYWSAPVETAPTIGGTRASPTAITAAGGITAGSGYHQIQFIEGDAGAVDITANPQVSAGSNVGERLTLIGRNDTNTVTLDDGTGLSLNGQAVLSADTVINLMWDGTNWLEISRRTEI